MTSFVSVDPFAAMTLFKNKYKKKLIQWSRSHGVHSVHLSKHFEKIHCEVIQMSAEGKTDA
jgi:hypothetical protein